MEIGDWQQFTGATIGAYLGLVPTEDSSGDRHSQGGITKAGNTHARRLHHRWVSLDSRKKRPTVTAVAVARELAGWCWSLAVMDP